MLPNCFIVGVLLCLVRPDIYIYIHIYIVFVAFVHPRLKKRYHNRVKRVKDYLETVKDFDELISSQSPFSPLPWTRTF